MHVSTAFFAYHFHKKMRRFPCKRTMYIFTSQPIFTINRKSSIYQHLSFFLTIKCDVSSNVAILKHLNTFRKNYHLIINNGEKFWTGIRSRNKDLVNNLYALSWEIYNCCGFSRAFPNFCSQKHCFEKNGLETIKGLSILSFASDLFLLLWLLYAF